MAPARAKFFFYSSHPKNKMGNSKNRFFNVLCFLSLPSSLLIIDNSNFVNDRAAFFFEKRNKSKLEDSKKNP